jgi:mannose-6-phosphate isomerase-like protein (cupin superfamily)
LPADGILEVPGFGVGGDLPPTEVGPGDLVLIPPLCRQRITNIGQSDLVFLCVCIPGYRAEAYET